MDSGHDKAHNFPTQSQIGTIPSFNRQIPDSMSTAPVDPIHFRAWAPTSVPGPRRPPTQRPVTIHEGAFSADFAGSIPQANPTSWNDLTGQTFNDFAYHHDPIGQALEMPNTGSYNPGFDTFHDQHQHYQHEHEATTPERTLGMVPHKPTDEHLDFPGLDPEFPSYGNDITSTDENTPIINLGKGTGTLDEPLNLDTSFSRRYSGSSLVSSTGAQNEVPDTSAYSEVPSYASDYTPRSSLNLSATALSPVPSPRYPHHTQDIIRTGSRSRASPSPRPSVRVAPYTLDSGRNKRWSTGCFGSSPARRNSPFVCNTNDGHLATPGSALSRIDSPGTSTPASSFLPSNNLASVTLHNSTLQNPPRFHRPTPVLGSNYDSPSNTFNGITPVLPSNHTQLFRTLASNCDHYLHPHLEQYACLSDPPDLFGSLSEEPNAPPPEDMAPSDPELIPHEQELRFENDLYTPRWVRGHGNKREGWCGICKPGRWLVLKNSAFWYDKSFTHGVSAATGQAFDGPKDTRRMEGNADVWEGLCGSCGDWIALVSSKKKGTTWFRHAYKCHTHAKVKDAPKRRRESSNTRPSSSSATPKAKADPITPDMSSSLAPDNIGPGNEKNFSSLHSITSII